VADNRYSVEIIGIKTFSDPNVLVSSLEPIIGEGERVSPLGRPLKSTEWFYDYNQSTEDGSFDEGTWVYSRSIVDPNPENTAAYGVQLRFISGIDAEDIDSRYFYYSLGIQFSNRMKKNKRTGEPAFYGARIERGSTLIEFYAGAVIVAGGIAAYPKVRTGLFEILSDVKFLSKSLQKALKVSTEIPLRERKEPHIERPFQKYSQIPPMTETNGSFRSDLRANRGGWDV